MRSGCEVREQRRTVIYCYFFQGGGWWTERLHFGAACLPAHTTYSVRGPSHSSRPINSSSSWMGICPSPQSCGGRLGPGARKRKEDKLQEQIAIGCVLCSRCRWSHLESAIFWFISYTIHTIPGSILTSHWLLLLLLRFPNGGHLACTNCLVDKYSTSCGWATPARNWDILDSIPATFCLYYALSWQFPLLHCPGRDTSFTHTAELKVRQKSKEDSCPMFLLCLDIQAGQQILPSKTLFCWFKRAASTSYVLFKSSLLCINSRGHVFLMSSSFYQEQLHFLPSEDMEIKASREGCQLASQSPQPGWWGICHGTA